MTDHDLIREARLTIEKALRERGHLARLVAFKTDFFELPQVAQDALYGIASLLDDAVEAVARANQLEKALREIEARDYGYSPHGTKRDPRSTVQVIKDALAGVPAEPATEETRVTYGGQFVQPVETRGVTPTHVAVDVEHAFGVAASSVSAGAGQVPFICQRCAKPITYAEHCPDCRDEIAAKFGTGQVPADTENELRREWWLNHGHPFHALYGDDGEMQCAACPCDFQREPLDDLRHRVLVTRAALAAVRTPEEQP